MPTRGRRNGKGSTKTEWDTAFQQGAASGSGQEPVLKFGHSSPRPAERLKRASELEVPLLSLDSQSTQQGSARAKVSPAEGDKGKGSTSTLAPSQVAPSTKKQEAGAPAEAAPWYQSTIRSVLYGVINTVVVAPVMIGFAAIIFRHKAFHTDPSVYARLVKLCLFSSAVHQSAFTATSSLPFAIGQVQDAGLIFLSKMASDIADAMKDDPPEHMLATVLVTLSTSTALLGLALILTGHCTLQPPTYRLPLPASHCPLATARLPLSTS